MCDRKETVPAIGEFRTAVADQIEELVGPTDQVIWVIGIAVDNSEVPAAFSQGLLGEFPGLLVLLPACLPEGVGSQLGAARLQFLL